GVRRVEGEVVDIDATKHVVAVAGKGGQRTFGYDRLVCALGSELQRPSIDGLSEHAFDVDTYRGASRLDDHLPSLPDRSEAAGQLTVVVVGAGLTGIEAACEMPARLRAILDHAHVDRAPRVLLVDRSPHVGSNMGDSARPVIEQALIAQHVDTRLGV